jgi:hypothetical protein
MKVVLRDRDFANLAIVDAYEYTYYNDNEHNGSFKVFGSVSPATYEGGVLCVMKPDVGLSHVSLIKTIKPATDGSDASTITTEPLINIFDRSIAWSYDGIPLGFAVNDACTDNWTNQSDAAYAAPWLIVDVQSSDTVVAPELDDAGYIDYKKWLLALVDAGAINLCAYPSVSPAGNTQCLFGPSPARAVVTDWRVNFAAGEYELIEESYAATQTAKITNHTYDETSEEWSATDYYLFDDGSYGTDPAAGTRVRGTWRHMLKKTIDDVETEFAKSKLQHCIKFYAAEQTRRYVGCPVTLRMPDGRVIASRITTVRVKSDECRVYYEAGLLKTRLTDMIKGGVING